LVSISVCISVCISLSISVERWPSMVSATRALDSPAGAVPGRGADALRANADEGREGGGGGGIRATADAGLSRVVGFTFVAALPWALPGLLGGRDGRNGESVLAGRPSQRVLEALPGLLAREGGGTFAPSITGTTVNSSAL
jgi:hypothetical protein